MKVPRIEIAKTRGFSHYGSDCPLKVLWKSLYKAKSYEEFCMLSEINQENCAPIDLGVIQAFIYEYSSGLTKNEYARRKLEEYRDILIVERFRRGEASSFPYIWPLLEPEEIEPGAKAYCEWKKKVHTHRENQETPEYLMKRLRAYEKQKSDYARHRH